MFSCISKHSKHSRHKWCNLKFEASIEGATVQQT